MPSKRAEQALLDIRDNAKLAQQFAVGMTLGAFKEDRRTFYAVARCLEIVSEASRRLTPAMRERHPTLPWRAIMGLGNVYRHDYDNVVEEYVWHTVQHSLAALLEVIEDEIARLPNRS